MSAASELTDAEIRAHLEDFAERGGTASDCWICQEAERRALVASEGTGT